MNSKAVCAICGMIIVVAGVVEELNPHLAEKIPVHMHPEGHAVLVYGVSPTATTSGSAATVTKSMTYVVTSGLKSA